MIKTNLSGIPEELKKYDNWVLYNLQNVPGRDKPTKVPLRTNGRNAKSNNPATWAKHTDVEAAYRKGNFDGFGFAVDPDRFTPLGGDMDNVVCPAFKDDPSIGYLVEKWAEKIVETLNTTTTITPSGHGLRFWVYGDIPNDGRNKRLPQYAPSDCKKDRMPGIELYKRNHYLTETGVHLPGTPLDVAHRPREILEVYDQFFGGDNNKPLTEIVEPGASCEVANKQERQETQEKGAIQTDEQIIEMAGSSKNGERFKKLWNGDFSDYGSRSDADLALCGTLAFWTGRDPAAMDRLFRRSGLMRQKWIRKHAASGLTYGQMTLNLAIAGCTKIYEPVTTKEVDLDGYIKKMDQGENDPGAPAPAADAQKKAVIERLNEKYAVVLRGNEACIMHQFRDPLTGRDDEGFMGVRDFKLLLQNKKIYIKSGKKPKQISEAELWLDDEDRRQFDSVVFEPSQEKIPGVYNLYKGLGCESRRGEWSRMRDHIFEIICNGCDDDFKCLMDWQSDIIQHPGGDKKGVVPVLQGEPGTGKGTWAMAFGSIIGRNHFRHLIDTGMLTGRFNGWIKAAILIVADESFFAGNKQAAQKLKGMITERNIVIEEKFRDPLTVANHASFIFISNEEWVIQAQPGERRYFCLRVSSKRIGDTGYFKKIQDELNNGGRQAMLYDLQQRDLAGVDLRKFPKKDALFDQILRSLTPVQSFWFECLRSCFLGAVSQHDTDSTIEWPSEIETRRFYQMFMMNNQFNKYSPCDAIFGRELKKMCPGITKKQRANGWRYYEIPSLADCRKDFEEFVKMPINWEV